MKTSKQKRFAAAFAGMLCISCLTTPFSAAAEDTGITGENDTIAAAEEMPLNTAVSGEISTKGDVDYYKITLPEDGTLQIGLTAGWVSDFGDSYCITLYDADGTEISKESSLLPSGTICRAAILWDGVCFSTIVTGNKSAKPA